MLFISLQLEHKLVMKGCPFEHILLSDLLDRTYKQQMPIILGIVHTRPGMMVIQRAKIIVVSGDMDAQFWSFGLFSISQLTKALLNASIHNCFKINQNTHVTSASQRNLFINVNYNVLYGCCIYYIYYNKVFNNSHYQMRTMCTSTSTQYVELWIAEDFCNHKS